MALETVSADITKFRTRSSWFMQEGPTPSDKCPDEKRGHGEKEGHVEMKAGTGVMRPPAKEHEEPPETGGAARSLSWSLQRAQPSRHLGVWLPGFRTVRD